MPKGRTLYGWSTNSSYPIEGVTEPMEYAYYTSSGYWSADDQTTYGSPPMLDFNQVANMSDPNPSFYGMTNSYNSMLLVYSDFYTKNYTMFQ